MVIIFDLDDTLYDEKTFVFSGFEHVANWIASLTSFSQEEILSFMLKDLEANGRGKVFDATLEKFYKKNKVLIKKCLTIYRVHQPEIKLLLKNRLLLQELKKKHSLYIVTDGNKMVQANKVKALDLEGLVKKVFITHRYGLKASKPSLICFEKIKQIEKVEWEDIAYVGDNPHKDFVNLNSVNALTIRVLQGEYANLNVDKEYDGQFKVNDVVEVKKILGHEI